MVKTYATIYVDEEIIRKAKEIGLNISKTRENALKEAIKRLEGSNPIGKREKDSQSSMWTGRDLNPRPRRCQRLRNEYSVLQNSITNNVALIARALN